MLSGLLFDVHRDAFGHQSGPNLLHSGDLGIFDMLVANVLMFVMGTGKDKTKYTDKAVAEGATVGGSSWTKEWLKFDNSYFKGLKQQDDEHLLVLETDGVLMTDPKFK